MTPTIDHTETATVVNEEGYQSMSKAHFLVVVAKDAIVKQFGAKINSWPVNNYWAMVSCVKHGVRDEQIPALMAQYNITKLSDFPLQER